jgi:hypothetical protein
MGGIPRIAERDNAEFQPNIGPRVPPAAQGIGTAVANPSVGMAEMVHRYAEPDPHGPIAGMVLEMRQKHVTYRLRREDLTAVPRPAAIDDGIQPGRVIRRGRE